MKKALLILLLLGAAVSARAQFGVTARFEGDLPAEALRRGFSVQQQVLVQMDADPQPEEVILLGRDNGHWPELDLFKFYVAIVGHYTREVKHLTDIYVSDRYELTVEDRDGDGLAELYVTYIEDGSFSTDARGYNCTARWLTDRIEFTGNKEDAR